MSDEIERDLSDKAATIRYVLKRHFSGDEKLLANAAGINVATLRMYLSGVREPRFQTVEYILHLTYTPEFSIICEYKKTPEKIGPAWITKTLGSHANATGIYAFYDSMAKLCYLGKASTNLSKEIYQSISQKHKIKMPSGINSPEEQRKHSIHYMSAYFIKTFDSWDYTKHVESLFLRISKPPMNKQSGVLEKAYSAEK